MMVFAGRVGRWKYVDGGVELPVRPSRLLGGADNLTAVENALCSGALWEEVDSRLL